MKRPGPDHPITVEPEPRRVRVVVAGVAVAETRNALRLQEARYPPVFYVPRSDIRAEHFVASTRTSHCPYKGDAHYYDLVVDGTRRSDAVWSYGNPYPAVAAIRDHVAFYPDRIDAIVLED
ncbi:uncharacterized protein (DUF427 family) [Methylobacterium sp. PvP062]|uniref:Uncharacterized protein (DUF427 family) n=1 Tax=Methylobacterium radiotolerans TaxID=31998 RepID=A0ABV2NMQ6_9HYPH|nr:MULTISPECIES: DUF427 domain-containing protein [unclassified Methylobacterium]MBP2495475.1 uncharacterized protein (DUF427 family) [Methylobacterium sp. PvP105]MBP2504654.1 uncharacterized protein (DUF427 family) [Methylobacterium sp. PvP109]MCX7332257.1 DUF427 domain-containing protein [Hyphomicrobiales bacterium]